MSLRVKIKCSEKFRRNIEDDLKNSVADNLIEILEPVRNSVK